MDVTILVRISVAAQECGIKHRTMRKYCIEKVINSVQDKNGDYFVERIVLENFKKTFFKRVS